MFVSELCIEVSLTVIKGKEQNFVLWPKREFERAVKAGHIKHI